MGFFTQKSKLSQSQCYENFVLKMRVKKKISCADFYPITNCRVKLLYTHIFYHIL
jgi:hypothetical protein